MRDASRRRWRTELFAAELSPGGARFVEPDGDGWLVHTNHFLAAPPRGRRHAAGRRIPARWLRRGALARAPHGRGASPRRARASTSRWLEPVCRHDDPPGTRLGGPARDAARGRAGPGRAALRVAAGPPCESRVRAVRPAAAVSPALAITVDVDGEAGLPGRRPRLRAPALAAARSAPTACVRGLPRILRVLEESRRARRRSTCPASPRCATRDEVAAIVERGHEVGHHGHTHRRPDALTSDEQRAELERGLEALARFGVAAARLPRARLGADARHARRCWPSTGFALRLEPDGRRPAVPSAAGAARSSSCPCTGASTTRRYFAASADPSGLWDVWRAELELAAARGAADHADAAPRDPRPAAPRRRARGACSTRARGSTWRRSRTPSSRRGVSGYSTPRQEVRDRHVRARVRSGRSCSSCGSREPRSSREISAASSPVTSESPSCVSPAAAAAGAGSPRTEPSDPRARMLSVPRASHQGQNLKSLLIRQFFAATTPRRDRLRARSRSFRPPRSPARSRSTRPPPRAPRPARRNPSGASPSRSANRATAPATHSSTSSSTSPAGPIKRTGLVACGGRASRMRASSRKASVELRGSAVRRRSELGGAGRQALLKRGALHRRELDSQDVTHAQPADAAHHARRSSDTVYLHRSTPSCAGPGAFLRRRGTLFSCEQALYGVDRRQGNTGGARWPPFRPTERRVTGRNSGWPARPRN